MGSAISHAQLNAQLSQGTVVPLYAVVGEEDLLRDITLTMGDFIVPTTLGNSSFFIGQAVLAHQGTSGNIPLAAAFTVIPMAIMILYLVGARRLGAFDSL